MIPGAHSDGNALGLLTSENVFQKGDRQWYVVLQVAGIHGNFATLF